jgi:hypothetical protein
MLDLMRLRSELMRSGSVLPVITDRARRATRQAAIAHVEAKALLQRDEAWESV